MVYVPFQWYQIHVGQTNTFYLNPMSILGSWILPSLSLPDSPIQGIPAQASGLWYMLKYCKECEETSKL